MISIYSLRIYKYILLAFFLFLPLQSTAQNSTQNNFLTDWLGSLRYTGWYFCGTAIGQVLPYGIQQPYSGLAIPASDVSPLGGWGYGYVTWFDNVVISMSINKRLWQFQQPKDGNVLTQNAGGIDFMVGYTVQRYDHVKITPTLEVGGSGYPISQTPNPFWHLGGSLGLTYSIPFYSLASAEKNKYVDFGSIIALNLGYVQYFSIITSAPTQTALLVRLRVGLGGESQPIQP